MIFNFLSKSFSNLKIQKNCCIKTILKSYPGHFSLISPRAAKISPKTGIGHRYWNKPPFWNMFAADQLVFQNRGFTVISNKYRK